MTIRPVATDDIDGCARSLVRAYNQAPWRHNWDFEKAVKYLREYLEVKQFVGFVLCEGDEIAGAIFAHSKTWWANDQLFIDELFISDHKQRSGYGKRLLGHAEQYAKDHGLKSLSLMTNKFMPAFHSYNKLNFFHAEQLIFLFREIH